jgi:hypothetical protein
MELLKEFFSDPVLFFSFTGLAVVVGICIFYVIYFIRNTMNAEAPDTDGQSAKPQV